MEKNKNIFTKVWLGCIALLLTVSVYGMFGQVKDTYSETKLYGKYKWKTNISMPFGLNGVYSVNFTSNNEIMAKIKINPTDYCGASVTYRNHYEVDHFAISNVQFINASNYTYSCYIPSYSLLSELTTGGYDNDYLQMDFGTSGATINAEKYCSKYRTGIFAGQCKKWSDSDISVLTNLIASNTTMVNSCYHNGTDFHWGHGSSYPGSTEFPMYTNRSDCESEIVIAVASYLKLAYDSTKNKYSSVASVEIVDIDDPGDLFGTGTKEFASYVYITIDASAFGEYNFSDFGIVSNNEYNGYSNNSSLLITYEWENRNSITGPYASQTSIKIDGTKKLHAFVMPKVEYNNAQVVKVTLDPNGGTLKSTKEIYTLKGYYISKPKDPTHPGGANFLGWYTGYGDPFDFGKTPITSNMTLYAKWETDSIVRVRFYKYEVLATDGTVTGGTELISEQWIEKGGIPVEPEKPEGDEKYVVGWKIPSGRSGYTVYKFDRPVNSNTDFYPIWESKERTISFSIKCETTGQETLKSSKAYLGETFTKLETDPTCKGYTFRYWEYNGEEYDFATKVTKDITVKAVWDKKGEEKYTVKFDTNGGTPIDTQLVDNGGVAVKPQPDPVKEGSQFEYWMLDGRQYDFNTKITSHIVLTAKWLNEYTIKYDANGGSVAPNDQIYNENEKVQISLIFPRKIGYKFIGWSTSKGCTSSDVSDTYYRGATVEKKNITLYACWKAEDSTEKCSLRSNPETGDSNLIWLILLEIIAIGSLISYFIIKKRKNSNV